MAHFKDLEKCDYFGGQLKDVLLAVGWLDKDHEFSQGKVSEVNMDLLKMYCEKPLWVHVFRGFHDCNLCETQGSRNDNKGVFSNAGLFGVQKESGQLESGIGKRKSALNVFVPYKDKIFVAPENIVHYIIEHGYQPPNEFFDVLRSAPKPDQRKLIDELVKIGGNSFDPQK